MEATSAVASSAARDDATLQQVQRITDVEATNQAQLDLAIQESRRSQASYEYDDLETCLALSLTSHNGNLPFTLNQTSSRAESKQNDELINGDIVKSVQQQSEMDYIDQAIVSSLVQDPVMTDEELLQAALLSSVKEAEEEELRRLAAVAAMTSIPTNISTSGHVKSEDEMMEMALKLSQMSEEEALELALSQSLQHKPLVNPTPPGAVTSSNSSSSVRNTTSTENQSIKTLSEEEQLRLAMAESLQSFQPSSNSSSRNQNNNNSNNNNNNTNAMLIYGFGDDMEYDEDLMRAIQESYK